MHSLRFELWISKQIKNVVVQKITDDVSDRSFNNKDLLVVGTINRAAVATGAELVSYGGFTSGNYLEQS